MVSHPEVVPTSSRRAPSVSSRNSRSRHHHRGRSYHGGASYSPQNEFPFFARTGDVEIVIASDGQEKRYLLHRLILGQFSGFFEAGMSDEWSRSRVVPSQPPLPELALSVIGEELSQVSRQPPAARADQIQAMPGRKRWRYELDWASAEDDEEPMLIQKVRHAVVDRRPSLTCAAPVRRSVHGVLSALANTASTATDPVVLSLCSESHPGTAHSATVTRRTSRPRARRPSDSRLR